MERGALSTAEFREFAKEYVLFCHITSHVEGDAYQDLLGKKGGGGWPYLVAMDADGNVLAKHSGPRSAEGFLATMKKGEDFQVLMAKEDLTPAERLDLFHQRLDLGHFDIEQAKAEVEKLGELSEEELAKIDAALIAMEVEALAPTSREDVPRAAKAYAEMYAAGRVPAGGRPYANFFSLILEHAFTVGDAALFEDALGKLRAKFGSNPRAQGFFDAQVKRLAELKAKAAEENVPEDDGDAPEDDGE